MSVTKGADFQGQSKESLEAIARVVQTPDRCSDCGGRFVKHNDINTFCELCEDKRWEAFMEDPVV